MYYIQHESLTTATTNDAIASSFLPTKLTAAETWNRNNRKAPSPLLHELVDPLHGQESFSACMVFMDENHRLTEFLAYHYYMLPLRHLVLHVDPVSTTSPEDIIDRWKNYVNIEVWSDEHIMAQVEGLDFENIRQSRDGIRQVYVQRQRHFYGACGRHLRALGKTWVVMTDIDEFVYLDPEQLPDAVQRMDRPGSVLQFLHDAQDPVKAKAMGISLSQLNDTKQLSCLQVTRTYFGAKEAPATVQKIQQELPLPLGSFLNVTHFETLRFLHRDHPHGVHRMWNERISGSPRSIIHLQRIKDVAIPPLKTTPHQILKECVIETSLAPPIRIRHYLGSFESYFSRWDTRIGGKRSYEFYEYMKQIGKLSQPDDAVHRWLGGFCKLVSIGKQADFDAAVANNKTVDFNETRIRSLLQGTGQVRQYCPELRNVSFRMTPDNYIKFTTGKQHSRAKFLRSYYQIVTVQGENGQERQEVVPTKSLGRASKTKDGIHSDTTKNNNKTKKTKKK